MPSAVLNDDYFGSPTGSAHPMSADVADPITHRPLQRLASRGHSHNSDYRRERTEEVPSQHSPRFSIPRSLLSLPSQSALHSPVSSHISTHHKVFSPIPIPDPSLLNIEDNILTGEPVPACGERGYDGWRYELASSGSGTPFCLGTTDS